jgi:hypothetical protein
MKALKLKTFVLTVSKTFMKGHPRCGEATGFKDAVLQGKKIHTIRAGEYWRKVIDMVNAGKAILSVREWSGKPYASKQVEICQYTKLGLQEFEFKWGIGCIEPFVDNNIINVDDFCDLAENDGLQKHDFLSWFKYPKPFKGLIIHFTDFRY